MYISPKKIIPMHTEEGNRTTAYSQYLASDVANTFKYWFRHLDEDVRNSLWFAYHNRDVKGVPHPTPIPKAQAMPKPWSPLEPKQQHFNSKGNNTMNNDITIKFNDINKTKFAVITRPYSDDEVINHVSSVSTFGSKEDIRKAIETKAETNTMLIGYERCCSKATMNADYRVKKDGTLEPSYGAGDYCKHCGAKRVFEQVQTQGDKALTDMVAASVDKVVAEAATSTNTTEARLAN